MQQAYLLAHHLLIYYLKYGTQQAFEEFEGSSIKGGKLLPSYIILGSFICLFLLDRVMKSYEKSDFQPMPINSEESPHKGNNIWIILIIMSLHSFLEGTAVGISNNYQSCLDLVIAICLHKWAESFAVVRISTECITDEKQYHSY